MPDNMNIAHWPHRAGLVRPDSPAVAHGGKVVFTYRQLSARIAHLAGALRHDLGLKTGDRVALVMKNVPEYIEILFAIWHAGLVAVPVNAKLHPGEYQYLLSDSGARLCFTTSNTHESIIRAAENLSVEVVACNSTRYERMLAFEPVNIARVETDDLAWLFYTSGTTGRPKGAMLTHRNLTVMTLNYFVDFDRVRPGDSILHPAPLSHGSGLWMLPHVCAGAINVIPESGGFDPAEIFALVKTWPRVSFFAAPVMVRRLVLHDDDSKLENLKLITYGGAPMYVADCIAALDRFGARLAQLYGQGEAPMTITHLPCEIIADQGNPGWRRYLASAGYACSCVEVAIFDENDNRLPPGKIGQIVCRGDVVMAGYWNNETATAETLAGGWLHTGDIGFLDKDGFLTLTGRSKDVIISGGTNIYPREVEEVLLTAPGVAEVSVIGTPDEEWGEIVTACVVMDSNCRCDEAGLDAHCLAHLARFKRPRKYRFMDALPKNNYGKVLKTVLRKTDNAN